MGMPSWGKVEDYLVNHLGRRVLTFDLFGRGLSDSCFPNNAELFTSQLADLLFALSDQLGPSKYDIIGKSMGGAIAAHFCSTFPQKINKAVLWAPAGLPVPYPLTAEIAKLPLLGDFLMPLVGPTTLANHIQEGFFSRDDSILQAIQNSKAILKSQIDLHPGFLPSMLSTIRHYPLGSLHEEFRSLPSKFENDSILILWGEEDTVTPFSNAKVLKEMLGETAKLQTIPQAGHEDAYHIPDLFQLAVDTIENFLE